MTGREIVSFGSSAVAAGLCAVRVAAGNEGGLVRLAVWLGRLAGGDAETFAWVGVMATDGAPASIVAVDWLLGTVV